MWTDVAGNLLQVEGANFGQVSHCWVMSSSMHFFMAVSVGGVSKQRHRQSLLPSCGEKRGWTVFG